MCFLFRVVLPSPQINNRHPNSRYSHPIPLSNACGQLGQSYQDYHCSEEEKHMECPVDPNMSITAVTHARWYGAPAPLYCGPKTDEQPFTGFWDHSYSCDRSWANPPESCDVYEDQKAGQFDHSKPYANTAGRTDVEGCCWVSVPCLDASIECISLASLLIFSLMTSVSFLLSYLVGKRSDPDHWCL